MKDNRWCPLAIVACSAPADGWIPLTLLVRCERLRMLSTAGQVRVQHLFLLLSPASAAMREQVTIGFLNTTPYRDQVQPSPGPPRRTHGEQRQGESRNHRIAISSGYSRRIVSNHAGRGRGRGRGLAHARVTLPRSPRNSASHGVFTDYREMLKEKDIEMVTIAAPNSLHAQMTKDCAAAGKHIVCEKPLAMTIAEGEEMIAAAKRHSVLLMYGEELLFTPKYLKAKEMADAGAFGKIYLVKQSEKHFGPHSEWFWDVNRSGGGALMDLGCHGIAFCYWFLGRPPSNRSTARWELTFTGTNSSRRRFAMHSRVR